MACMVSGLGFRVQGIGSRRLGSCLVLPQLPSFVPWQLPTVRSGGIAVVFATIADSLGSVLVA